MDFGTTDEYNAVVNFVKANPDLIPIIFRHVPVDVLAVAGSTSRSARAMCQKEMRERFYSVARLYVDDVARLCRVMLGTNAVISGSSVLFVIDPSNVTWFPTAKDLDLYVSLWHSPKIIEYLTKVEGYEEVKKTNQNGTGALVQAEAIYFENWTMRSLFDVQVFVRPRDGKRIDVMISKSLFGCTLPIFEFHTSIVMNFMTPTLLFCAYPIYTLKKVGLINWRVISNPNTTVDNELYAVFFDRAAEAIKKYNDRGYTLGMSPRSWDSNHAENCSYGGQCRGYRTTLDGYCLTLPFSMYTGLEVDADTRVSFNWSGSLPGGHVEWSLGGRACVNTDDLQDTFYIPSSHRVNW